MSVATHLGVDDPNENVLALARTRWPGWQQSHPALRVVPDLLELPEWLRAADRADADRVLLALATLSSPEGGNDVAATAALAWVLLPGASLLAARLATLTPRIDELLAAQLWVQARTFPWQRGHRVAANILMNARKGVLRDLRGGEGAGPAVAHSIPVDPAEQVWRDLRDDEAGPAPEEELADLLAWACAEGVLSDSDRALLVEVAVTADRHGTARTGRGHAGLLANTVSQEVAARRGVSAVTVRRRTRRSVQALRQACGTATRIPA